jgi:hypothetical protein
MAIRIGAVATELAHRYAAAPTQAAWAVGVGLQALPGDDQLLEIRASALAVDRSRGEDPVFQGGPR